MSLDAERRARVLLSRATEPGYPQITGPVAEHGAVAVLQRLRGGDVPEGLAARLRDGVSAEQELERAARRGIRFVMPGDPEWPAALDDLAHAEHLHARGGVPLGLWLKGGLRLDEVCEHSVAVVGSRSATTYGASIAGEVAATVGGAGYAVVSGAAFGIDQAAHRGALASRAPTVAVLACGPDRAYPAAHAQLIDYISDVGLVVSESPPGCAPTRIRFLARNRLIAGLSRGTVVVEAAIRSGALNTASWSEALGRPVMGIPGPVTSAPSEGVHQLIRSRGATLVTRGEEVLECIGPLGSFALAEPREPVRPRDLLSAEQRQVLDAVPAWTGVSASGIAHTAAVPTPRAEAALAVLFKAGLVEKSSGRFRLAAHQPDGTGAGRDLA